MYRGQKAPLNLAQCGIHPRRLLSVIATLLCQSFLCRDCWLSNSVFGHRASWALERGAVRLPVAPWCALRVQGSQSFLRAGPALGFVPSPEPSTCQDLPTRRADLLVDINL